jgi:hypothetical protein
MRAVDAAPFDPRPLMVEERADLLTLLAGLSDEQWVLPTESGHWRVKEVALHLLDDDLGWLSRARDHDRSGLLPRMDDHAAFVRSLDAKNEAWVVGAGGLSRRVVVDLLAWSGDEVAAYHDGVDLDGRGDVLWAGGDVVPAWLDLGRDLTERWVHQQHVRDAVGQPGDHHRFLPAVLRTFVWAFPHQYAAVADDGTTVQLDLDVGGTWTLTRTRTTWVLDEAVAARPAATLAMPASVAWRQLTGLPVDAGDIRADGDPSLLAPLLEVRSIIV